MSDAEGRSPVCGVWRTELLALITFPWFRFAFLLITFLSLPTRTHTHRGEAHGPLL